MLYIHTYAHLYGHTQYLTHLHYKAQVELNLGYRDKIYAYDLPQGKVDNNSGPDRCRNPLFARPF